MIVRNRRNESTDHTFDSIGIAVASGGNSKFEKKKVIDRQKELSTRIYLFYGLSIQLELLLPAAAIQNSKKKVSMNY